MIKLIATDMDGTFLDSNKKFSKEFFELFREMEKRNIYFVIASGNQYYRLVQKFLPISERMVYIAENGSYISIGHRIVKTHPIKQESVKIVLETLINDPRILVVLCGKNSAYALNKDLEYKSEIVKYYCAYQFVETFDNIDDEILKIAILDKTGHVLECVDKYAPLFPDNVQVVTSGHEWMDIQDKGINKGVALKEFSEQMNITPDECIAFGDQMNDYEMLKFVTHSCAMENAVDQIKDICQYIVPSNDQNGVIETIKEILK